MTAMNKRQLRAHLRSLHEGRSVRDVQSQEMCRHILGSDMYKNARVIGGYVPLAHEADITSVLQDALEKGKMLALPLCRESSLMTMHRVAALDELVPGRYGISSPQDDAAIIPIEDIDLLLVPLEGIDNAGFRLGKGGGYYDRLLAGANITTLGCALTWQWVTLVPRDSWDHPLSACADAHGIHAFEH